MRPSAPAPAIRTTNGMQITPHVLKIAMRGWQTSYHRLRGTGDRVTGNGERETENGERGTGNGKRRTGNGKRRTGNGKTRPRNRHKSGWTYPRAHTPTHGAANKARIQILSVQSAISNQQSAISNHHAAISKHQAAGNRQQTTTHKGHAGRRKKRTIGIPQASLNGGDTLNGEKKNGRLAESRPFE